MSTPTTPQKHTLSTLLPHLQAPLLPAPAHPHDPHLTPLIASALLHPTLEAALHLLNADLPSAHFLVRHMQAPPAVEGMLLHAILHRCEGDFANARAWAGDVGDACEGWVPKKRGEERLGGEVAGRCGMPGGKKEGEGESLVGWVYGEERGKGAGELIDAVEAFRKGGKGAGGQEKAEREKEAEELERKLKNELERVLEWCRRKFGDGSWVDASAAWVAHGEEVRKMGESMVSGGKGFREF